MSTQTRCDSFESVTMRQAAIVVALEKSQGNLAETARLLEVSRSTAYRWIGQCGLDPDSYRAGLSKPGGYPCDMSHHTTGGTDTPETPGVCSVTRSGSVPLTDSASRHSLDTMTDPLPIRDLMGVAPNPAAKRRRVEVFLDPEHWKWLKRQAVLMQLSGVCARSSMSAILTALIEERIQSTQEGGTDDAA